MKVQNKWFISAIIGITVSGFLSTSCVDEIKFGSSFLEKAPSGDVTIDTVFNSAEYTRQFLNAIYGRQYYGLPYKNSDTSIPASSDLYLGKKDALTDCWQIHWDKSAIYSQYYSGIHTANYGRTEDICNYTNEKVWEVVRWCWLLLENIDRVPDLSNQDKAQMIAEAKCLIAARYFDLFRHYGGLPLVYASFSGTEASYNMPRATVEATVNYMIQMLNDAIDNGGLVWGYTGADAAVQTGHWTKAGAMALKCKIWQFAASPLFNDNQGFAGGSTTAEQEHLVWYGSYRKDLWDNCLDACEKFFQELNANGIYQLNKASGAQPTAEDYRQAYRKGYVYQGSPEVIHSVRIMTTDAYKSGTYNWHQWSENGRNSYTPTQEYVEMFPWSDGTPFNWKETEVAGKLDEMFVKGDFTDGQLLLQNVVLTRDPRLYETVRVNGVMNALDWTSGTMKGDPYELWVGGTDAGQAPFNETGNYATGYDNMKYYLKDDYLRQYTQWVSIRLSDIYLTYAEALFQVSMNNAADAIEQIDIVRARVGLEGLARCNPDKDLLSDKDALLEELLRERVCELGMEDARYYDLVRYKRKDLFEKRLHGLLIWRLADDGTTVLTTKWREGDKVSAKTRQPIHFKYEKFELKNRTRYWWNYGFDPKWYLSPFPQSEVNKGYGLIQNPGW